jgi:DNA-binding NarL/FixJ family response regulator
MDAPRLAVLIVDDHPIIAAGLQCMLEDLGHEVVGIVGTGEEAIRKAKRHKPDCIIMDVHLAGKMDGIEAGSEIREHLGIRSIFFSGYSDPETRERANMAEPIAFLDKTSTDADLARVISAVAGERALTHLPHASRLIGHVRKSILLFV